MPGQGQKSTPGGSSPGQSSEDSGSESSQAKSAQFGSNSLTPKGEGYKYRMAKRERKAILSGSKESRSEQFSNQVQNYYKILKFGNREDGRQK